MEDTTIIMIIGAVVAAFVIGYFLRRYRAEAKIVSAAAEVKRVLEEA